MKHVLSFLVLVIFTSLSFAQDSTSYWMDKGVDFAVGAGASYVGNRLANSSNNKQQTVQTEQQQVIRVDGLSLICKWRTGYNTISGCWDDANNRHLQPTYYLGYIAGKNARLVRIFYMQDYAIIQYTLVEPPKK